MKIAIIQPGYLPGLGYFEQMAYADRFIALDDVQYTRRDWRNRNRVKTANGPVWLTVPVKKRPRPALIHEIEINYAEGWRRRHLRTIELNYRSCPHFQPLFSRLEASLAEKPAGLVELDCRLIELLRGFLGIDTPLSFSSEVPARNAATAPPDAVAARNQRIIDICLHFGATLLYDGAKAADFIDVERFRAAGIEVVFQQYRHPAYRQAFGEFLPEQSAIDLIMNTGPDAPSILRSSPVPAALAGRQARCREARRP